MIGLLRVAYPRFSGRNVVDIQSKDGLSCPEQHHTEVISEQHSCVVVDVVLSEHLQIICPGKSLLLLRSLKLKTIPSRNCVQLAKCSHRQKQQMQI